MQFNSYSYLLILPVVAVLFWLLPQRWRRNYLLAVSFLFYASWNLYHIFLPVALCAGVFYCGYRMLDHPERAGRWLWTGVIFILSILAFFKYREFFLDNASFLLSSLGMSAIPPMLAIALPLGISFYSFEAISYLIDTKQRRVKDIGFPNLLLFVMFWPHLIARAHRPHP